MPFHLPLDEPVHNFAAGEKQKAEILKQLYLKSRFLILDEPTSVLTPNEADEMLGLVRDMAHAGDITVLMITHKFREVRGLRRRGLACCAAASWRAAARWRTSSPTTWRA